MATRPQVRLRSAADLKTHAGVVGAAAKPTTRHAIALKIAMLEIERARRAKESLAASARARSIVERLREIEEESVRLQASLAELGSPPQRAPAEAGAAGATPGQDGAAPPRRRALRY